MDTRCTALITAGTCNLGVRSISSYLNKNGYKTKLFFLFSNSTEYPETILTQLKNLLKDTELIGISIHTLTLKKSIQLTEYLKSLNKKVVWGGPLPTTSPELAIKYHDTICIGEGEMAMEEYLRKYLNGDNTTNTRNFWIRTDGGRIIKNDLRPLIEDLDSLPFPDIYSESFRISFNKIVKCNHSAKVTFVYSIRGCPNTCTYCSMNKYRSIYSDLGKFVRKTSITKLISDLADVKAKMPNLSYIRFDDDNFLLRTPFEIEEFSKLYKQHIGLPFCVKTAPTSLTDEKIESLIKAGLLKINLGIQSGSDTINNKIYCRNIYKSDIIAAAQLLNKYKDRIRPPIYDLLIDSPFDKEEDILETIDLLIRLPKPLIVKPHSLVFIPGTKLHDMALEKNIAINDVNIGMTFSWFYSFKYDKTNYYLNSLIYWMSGLNTKLRYGIIPGFCMKFLLNKKFIKIMRNHRILLKFLNNIFPKYPLIRFFTDYNNTNYNDIR